MQRRWVRRLSPRVLVVALCSVAIVATAVAVSRADPRSGRALSVAMLSGGDAASLPGADMAPPGSTATPEAAPEPSPPTEPSSTTTTAAKSTAATAARAATVTAKPHPKPCPTDDAADRLCGPPPCPHPGQSNEPAKCPPSQPPPPPPPPPPTCRLYDIRTGASQPCPPPCGAYDTAGNSSSTCPQPCAALATADGKPAPCPPPPPCAQPEYGNGVSQPAYACPPPPPPPCPSAAPTDQSCTPPCSYEPASGGPAAGAFAPCASGVTGRVTAGPTCPVERPDEPCPDKPVETTLRLLRKDGSVAATEKSFSDGSFRLLAAPGSYRLVADWPSRIGGCGPVEVTVGYGRFTYTAVSCDTGIRGGH